MDPTFNLLNPDTVAVDKYREMYICMIQSDTPDLDTTEQLKATFRNCPCNVEKDRICGDCLAFFLQARCTYRLNHPPPLEKVNFEEKLKVIQERTQHKKDLAELNKYKHMYASTATDLATSRQECKAARDLVTKLNNVIKGLGFPEKCIQFSTAMMESSIRARLDRQRETENLAPGYVPPVSPSKRSRYVDYESPLPSFSITREYFDFTLSKLVETAKTTIDSGCSSAQAAMSKAILDAIDNKKFDYDKTTNDRLKAIDEELIKIQATHNALKNSITNTEPSRMLEMARGSIRELNELINIERLFRLPFPARRHPVVATREQFMQRYQVFRACARDGDFERFLGSTRAPKFVSFIDHDRRPLGNLIEFEGDTTTFIRSNAASQQFSDNDDEENDDQQAPR